MFQKVENISATTSSPIVDLCCPPYVMTDPQYSTPTWKRFMETFGGSQNRILGIFFPKKTLNYHFCCKLLRLMAVASTAYIVVIMNN